MKGNLLDLYIRKHIGFLNVFIIRLGIRIGYLKFTVFLRISVINGIAIRSSSSSSPHFHN